MLVIARRSPGGSPRGRVPTAWLSCRRLSSLIVWRTLCRRRENTGIATTGCLPRITGYGKPSHRWRSGTLTSAARTRPADMESAGSRPATPVIHKASPAPTTPRESLGPNSWPGWGRSFRSSARGVVATSDSSRYTQAGSDPEDPHTPRRATRAANDRSCPEPTDRLGRARAGPLSTGQSFRRRIDELPDIDIHSL